MIYSRIGYQRHAGGAPGVIVLADHRHIASALAAHSRPKPGVFNLWRPSNRQTLRSGFVRRLQRVFQKIRQEKSLLFVQASLSCNIMYIFRVFLVEDCLLFPPGQRYKLHACLRYSIYFIPSGSRETAS